MSYYDFSVVIVGAANYQYFLAVKRLARSASYCGSFAVGSSVLKGFVEFQTAFAGIIVFCGGGGGRVLCKIFIAGYLFGRLMNRLSKENVFALFAAGAGIIVGRACGAVALLLKILGGFVSLSEIMQEVALKKGFAPLAAAAGIVIGCLYGAATRLFKKFLAYYLLVELMCVSTGI